MRDIQPNSTLTDLKSSLGFAIHLEPGEDRPLRISLSRDGDRISSASPRIPSELKELILYQRSSLSLEKNLIEFFTSSKQLYPIYVNTDQGSFETTWDDRLLRTKTRFQMVGNRIRVEKALVDEANNYSVIDNFFKLGDNLVYLVKANVLASVKDISGWYVYGLVEEPFDEEVSEDEFELEYEEGQSASAFEEGVDEYQLDSGSTTKGNDVSPSFSNLSLATEISIDEFNSKNISYPKLMRGNYAKDLVFEINGESLLPQEKNLIIRGVLAHSQDPNYVSIQILTLWDDKYYESIGAIYKYLEYLNIHHSSYLRKKSVKEKLRHLALEVLYEEIEDDSILDEKIELLNIDVEDAKGEIREYLKRFIRKFVTHKTEYLLATKDGLSFVSLDTRQIGAIFLKLKETLGGLVINWMKDQGQVIEISKLFPVLKDIHASLSKNNVELYFNKKSVKVAKFEFKTQVFQNEKMDWLEVHPKINWEGKPIDDVMWKQILLQRGVLDADDQLVVLDDPSLSLLQSFEKIVSSHTKKKHQKDKPLQLSRLQILDWISLKKLGMDIDLPEENRKLVDKLLQFDSIQPRSIPKYFSGSLRDYQKDGYDWLLFLYEHKLGGCLADDMGLGKTIQAIAFLGGLHEGVIPSAKDRAHLIVVPPTLLFNWRSELKKFYSKFQVEEHSSQNRIKNLDNLDIILTTYEMMRKDEKFFKSKKFDVVIFDEAQFIKNVHAKRTQAAKQIKAKFVLTLTGTPLENHLGEYYSILDLSVPGLFGSYELFEKLYRSSDKEQIQRLNRRARPFVLRRTKDAILKELPKKSEQTIMLDMTDQQRALYQKVVSKVKKSVKQAFKTQPLGQANITALTAILRLRQICLSPHLFDTKSDLISPKVEYLVEKLNELVSEDHSALVFSQFKEFLDIIEEGLKRYQIEYFRMDGSTPPQKRKAMVESFQCGAGAPVFLISLKTGGVGLNLTRASYVFHMDPWWNPAVEDQASDRVYRIGQTKNVMITKVLMHHTIEEKILLLQRKKAKLYQEVMKNHSVEKKSSNLTKEDFEFLLGSSE